MLKLVVSVFIFAQYGNAALLNTRNGGFADIVQEGLNEYCNSAVAVGRQNNGDSLCEAYFASNGGAVDFMNSFCGAAGRQANDVDACNLFNDYMADLTAVGREADAAIERSGNIFYDLLDIIYNYCESPRPRQNNDDEVCQYMNNNFNNDIFSLFALAEYYGMHYCIPRQGNSNEFCDYFISFNGDIHTVLADANTYLADNCIAAARQASDVCGLYEQSNGNIYGVWIAYCTSNEMLAGRQANNNPLCQNLPAKK